MTSEDIFEALFRQVNDEVGLTKLRNIVLNDESIRCLSFGRVDADPIEFIKVVRCKNCKYWRKFAKENTDGGCSLLEINEGREPNDYCSKAERKNEVKNEGNKS